MVSTHCMLRHFIIGLLFAATACAQAPAFDVATVKRNTMAVPASEGGHRESIEDSPVSLTMHDVSLESCIEWAWNVQEYQVSAPEWIMSEKYNIAAKTGTPVSSDEMKLMLQTLLAERLNLATHRGTKEMPVYTLVVAKGGVKVAESAGEEKSAMNRIEGSLVSSIPRCENSRVIFRLWYSSDGPLSTKPGWTGLSISRFASARRTKRCDE